MEMNVYNSLTRRVEPLVPLAENTVRLYTCGPTVYNFAHIGNFRAYTFEDILRRVIQFNGMKVRQVMNLTDVDDKTIRVRTRRASRSRTTRRRTRTPSSPTSRSSTCSRPRSIPPRRTTFPR